MSKNKVAAYAQQQKRNLSPREVEAMAFTKAAVLLDVLININRNLAAGLRTNAEAEEAGTASSTASEGSSETA